MCWPPALIRPHELKPRGVRDQGNSLFSEALVLEWVSRASIITFSISTDFGCYIYAGGDLITYTRYLNHAMLVTLQL